MFRPFLLLFTAPALVSAAPCIALKDMYQEKGMSPTGGDIPSCCEGNPDFSVTKDTFDSGTHQLFRDLYEFVPPFHAGADSKMDLGNQDFSLQCGSGIDDFLSEPMNMYPFRRDIQTWVEAVVKLVGSTGALLEQSSSVHCVHGYHTATKEGFVCADEATKAIKLGGLFDNTCRGCDISYDSTGFAPTTATRCCAANATHVELPLPVGQYGLYVLWSLTHEAPGADHGGFYPEIAGGRPELGTKDAVLRELVDEHMQMCTSDPDRVSGIGIRMAYQTLRIPCYPMGDPIIRDQVLNHNLDSTFSILPSDEAGSLGGTSFLAKMGTLMTSLAPLFNTATTALYNTTTMRHVYNLYCDPTNTPASKQAHETNLVTTADGLMVKYNTGGANASAAYTLIVNEIQSGGKTFKYGPRARSLIPAFLTKQHSHSMVDSYGGSWTALHTPKTTVDATAAELIADLQNCMAMVYTQNEATWDSSDTKGVNQFTLYSGITLMTDMYDVSVTLTDGTTYKLGAKMYQLLAVNVFGYANAPMSAFTEMSAYSYEPKEYVSFTDAGTTMTEYMARAADPYHTDCKFGAMTRSVQPCLPITLRQPYSAVPPDNDATYEYTASMYTFYTFCASGMWQIMSAIPTECGGTIPDGTFTWWGYEIPSGTTNDFAFFGDYMARQGAATAAMG